MGGRRDGEIKEFADVDNDVDMDTKSVAESFCRIQARSHLFPGARVGEHAFIGENVMLRDYCILQSHAHVAEGAKIGSRTLCESHTIVGKRAVLFEDIMLVAHARVMDDAVIGANSFIDEHARIGRRTQLKQHVYVGRFTRIGSKSTIGNNAIVQEYVIMPSRWNIRDNSIVISAPETTILLRIVRGITFSKRYLWNALAVVYSLNCSIFGRFHDLVNAMTSQSHERYRISCIFN